MTDIAAIERRIQETLSPKRAMHTFGCAETARELALRFGGDADAAYLAGLLHDVTRERTLDEQLNLCRKYDIIPDEAEARDAGLLHSLTGAAVARDVFGVSEEIVHAIKVHTTGCVGMTRLDRILCLADYIEPTRHFKHVEELRALSRESLDRALLAALEGTIVHVIKKGEYLHPRTLDARNALLG